MLEHIIVLAPTHWVKPKAPSGYMVSEIIQLNVVATTVVVL